MNNPYGNDLAYIHDDGFGGFARQASRGILGLLQKAGLNDGLIVDLGCGSGIWAHIATENGYSAHGIDISENMIQLAQKQAPNASFEVNSFLKAQIPSCTAVTCMGECMNYLFDQDHSDEQLRLLFSRIHDALQPGGLFIFDVAGPGYADATGPHKRHFISEDWAVLVHVSEYKREQKLTRYITAFRKTEDGSYRRTEEVHRIQLLTGAHLAKILRDIGFKVRIRKGYGNFQLSPAHSVVIARKE
ncbi:MAG: class I SAM-dependent methyltransferase [Rhodothermaceae bacterium]|nr:class I SAM-dependent methyltransferase [Rhodothermaceae bacterium]